MSSSSSTARRTSAPVGSGSSGEAGFSSSSSPPSASASASSPRPWGRRPRLPRRSRRSRRRPRASTSSSSSSAAFALARFFGFASATGVVFATGFAAVLAAAPPRRSSSFRSWRSRPCCRGRLASRLHRSCGRLCGRLRLDGLCWSGCHVNTFHTKRRRVRTRATLPGSGCMRTLLRPMSSPGSFRDDRRYAAPRI